MGLGASQENPLLGKPKEPVTRADEASTSDHLNETDRDLTGAVGDVQPNARWNTFFCIANNHSPPGTTFYVKRGRRETELTINPQG